VPTQETSVIFQHQTTLQNTFYNFVLQYNVVLQEQVLGLHTTVITLRQLEMNILTPKQSGEFISKFAKNVFILPDGIKKLANEVSPGSNKFC
jgi:hypothetical protein